MKPKVSEAEFIRLFRELQSTTAVAKQLGCAPQSVNQRRRTIEKKYGIALPINDHRAAYRTTHIEQKAVAEAQVRDGVVVVGSDFHIWPGQRTTMQRAFIEFVRRLKPEIVVANGDVADFAAISRHAAIGWESRPTVKQELDAIQDFLHDVRCSSLNSKFVWPMGNHDMRFEAKIANALPEFARVHGVHLKDHCPGWIPCWRLDVNTDVTIRHRELGGEHADFRNTVSTGRTMVTGHDHRANVTVYETYGRRTWGVRCGYLGESPTDPQFVHYLEGKQPNWTPAFAVLTFKDGELLWPELVTKHRDGVVNFRGELIEV